MKKIVFLGLIIFLTGCAGANVTSQIREAGAIGESSKMLRCVAVKTGNESGMNGQLAKYDGWKMVYVSEYTTGNKTDTAAVVCFEKDKHVN